MRLFIKFKEIRDILRSKRYNSNTLQDSRKQS